MVFALPLWMLGSLLFDDARFLVTASTTEAQVVDSGAKLEIVDYVGPRNSGRSVSYASFARIRLLGSTGDRLVRMQGFETSLDNAPSQATAVEAVRQMFPVDAKLQVWCVDRSHELRCRVDRSPRLWLILLFGCYSFSSYWMMRYVYTRIIK